jgi:hypothetical protein
LNVFILLDEIFVTSASRYERDSAMSQVAGFTSSVANNIQQPTLRRPKHHAHHHHHKKASAAPDPNQTATTPVADSSPQSALSNLMSMLRSMFPGNSGAAADASSASDPSAQDAASDGKLNIAQIDDFSTDQSGFNHGREIAKTLNPDGNSNLLQFNIAGGDRMQNISNALDDVLAKVQSGQRVDAVEIPQVSANDGPAAQAIRDKIEQLTQAGVPVIIAAGNNGPNQHNFLETDHSFNVENVVNGKVSAQSGQGNIRANGRTTSFASANLALQVARLRSQGESVAQIFNRLA